MQTNEQKPTSKPRNSTCPTKRAPRTYLVRNLQNFTYATINDEDVIPDNYERVTKVGGASVFTLDGQLKPPFDKAQPLNFESNATLERAYNKLKITRAVGGDNPAKRLVLIKAANGDLFLWPRDRTFPAYCSQVMTYQNKPVFHFGELTAKALSVPLHPDIYKAVSADEKESRLS
jgi:hypothetical protein